MSNEEQTKKRIVQRAAAADFILSELEKGRFPYLSKFLKNTRFNLRQITDREQFDDRETQPDIETLLEASRASGTIHVSMEPLPRIALFYEKDLSSAEASLFALALQKTAALAFSALGLDMSGLVDVEDMSDKKLPEK
jgi:hypothetical protein